MAASRSRRGRAASTTWRARAPGPLWCIIDGNPAAPASAWWPASAVQRCCVHKLRNLERKAPKHALAELREDFHRSSTRSADAARGVHDLRAHVDERCPGVVAACGRGARSSDFFLPEAMEDDADDERDRAA